MKKLWLAMALLLVLLCWAGCAAAVEPGKVVYEECWLCEDGWVYYVPYNDGYMDGTSCILECNQCGHSWGVQYHFTYCDLDPTVCVACGQDGLYNDGHLSGRGDTINIAHRDEHLEFLGEGNEHRLYCNVCGLSEECPSIVQCVDPIRCAWCTRTSDEFLLEFMSHYYEYINLGITHGEVCQDCGYQSDYEEPHYAPCDVDTSKCAVCGATEYFYIQHLQHEYIDLGTQHQMICGYCGEQEEPENHVVFCDEPGVCYICEFDVTVNEEDQRHGEFEYVDCGKNHRQQCTRCGYQKEAEDHVAYCIAENECFRCGATIPPVDEDHLWHRGQDIDWKITATTCEEYCKACGYSWGKYEHEAICTSNTVCYYCKSTISPTDDAHTLHYTSNCKWEITETTCYWYCVACGYEDEKRQHEVSCTNPTVCLYCDTDDLRIDPLNYRHPGPVSNVAWTTTGHNFDCNACGAHVRNRAHAFSGGVCTLCGYVEGDPPALSIIPGDADGDEGIDLSDVLTILQYLVDLGDINVENADVNGDGKVDEQDALLILQYDAGWDVTLK